MEQWLLFNFRNVNEKYLNINKILVRKKKWVPFKLTKNPNINTFLRNIVMIAKLAMKYFKMQELEQLRKPTNTRKFI